MFRIFRILPLVLVLGAAVLAFKLAGIVHDARAQNALATPVVSQHDLAAPRDTDDADDQETSSAEVDVLTSLARRRAELDAREHALTLQQNLLAAAEKRVDDKIASLRALQARLATLLGQRDDEQKKEIDALVKSYSAMKPRDAARIFDALSQDVLVEVAARMKPDVLGAILAQMQPEEARKLTVELAGRLTPEASSPAATPEVAAVPPARVASTAAPAPAPTSSANTSATAGPSATPAAQGTSAAAKPSAAAPAPAAQK